MTVNLTGVVLANILYEHSNSTCDKEGLLLGKLSNIITDSISDSSLNNVQQQTVYYVHSFLQCDKLFSWYNSQGQVQAEALRNVLGDCKPEEVIGWYKLRRNSSLVPSIRERAIHQCLDDWMKTHSVDRRLVFFLCVSQSTHKGALYTTDHQFLIQDGRKFQSLPVNVLNLGNIAKPDYQTASNFACSTGSLYSTTVNDLRSNFVNGMGEPSSVQKVDALKTTLLGQLQKLCVKLVHSETELAKEVAEVKKLRLQLQSAQDFLAPVNQSKAHPQGGKHLHNTRSGQQTNDLIEFETEPPENKRELEKEEKLLIVFDDDEVESKAPLHRNNLSRLPVGDGKIGKEVTAQFMGFNQSHLLDENDAIQLLDVSDDDGDNALPKRQRPETKDAKQFEVIPDDVDVRDESTSPTFEHDLRGGVGRTARRTRLPKQKKTDYEAMTMSQAELGARTRTSTRKVYDRDGN